MMDNRFDTIQLLNKKRARIILSVLLIEYLLFILSGVSYSFLYGASMKIVNVDFTYWFVNLIQFPELVSHYYFIGVGLDLLTVLLLITSIWDPGKTWVLRILFILLLFFYITFNTYHTHPNIQLGYALILFPFCFKRADLFDIAWDFLRYYLLFFYFFAGIYKFIGGGIQEVNLMTWFLESQNALYFYLHPSYWRQETIRWLILHPYISWSLYMLAAIVESITIVGFFTKRMDKIIFILLVLFHLANWFLMDIAPFGMITFLLLLVLNPVKIVHQSHPDVKTC